MTTAKDLFIVALDVEPSRSVGQGDLSLALAGAELIDLLGGRAVDIDGDRIVPTAGQPATDDALLGEAASLLERDAPYERVEDWLWRRGRDLSQAYQTALVEAGLLTEHRRGRLSLGTARMEPADSPERQHAMSRWTSRDPVLDALASAVGIHGEKAFGEDTSAGYGEEMSGEGASGEDIAREEAPAGGDDPETTVLAAVHDAVMELEAVRQRRAIENAAFANIWRGP
ncbi:GOLPH3/VPS74 family protein [Streptomyces sp. 142MFCol3.1]|uniref:GOLPH3/VPS74 family protein n=1 Tax=Streptomyces sp. 142MFCol3.1 TaxID=1172179 RepID=UPI000414D5AF|nr:GPP34 family phosphoprotein [Streptomyces sp. 142MFCol3.1]